MVALLQAFCHRADRSESIPDSAPREHESSQFGVIERHDLEIHPRSYGTAVEPFVSAVTPRAFTSFPKNAAKK